MPLVSRIMIRLALFYFALGATIGGFLLINKAIDFNPELWILLPVHIELLIFGWIIQFTLGTAYWILPRLLEGEPRGNSRAAVLIPLCLNIGILMIILSDLLFLPQEVKMLGRMMELIAVVVFAALHWKRASKMIHTH